MSFKQLAVAECNEGDLISLIKEPENPHDIMAIKVMHGEEQIGYIPRTHTAVFHAMMDAEAIHNIVISSMGTAGETKIIGVMICTKYDHELLEKFLLSRGQTDESKGDSGAGT